MRIMIKKAQYLFCLFNIASHFLQSAIFDKTQMIQDLEIIKHHFEMGYAPAEWKKEYYGWDLNEAFEHSKNQILMTPALTTKQFQHIVSEFMKSIKDYHVDVLFYSTEEASLPFTVKGSGGRYIIDWVDPLRLSPSHYGIHPGDELLEFDDRPINEVITELARACSKSVNEKTDQRLTEMKLTLRSGSKGDWVPKGPIHITTLSAKTGKVNTHQLCWSYTPEYIKDPSDDILCSSNYPFMSRAKNLQKSKSFNPESFHKNKELKKVKKSVLDHEISFLSPNFYQGKLKQNYPLISMSNPLHQLFTVKEGDHKGGLGSRKSFLPFLGNIIWSNENEVKEDKVSFWNAYIYEHPEGYSIGYIRIPHYRISLAKVKEFGKILAKLEESTDALVIDQLHNFGGYFHIQYAIASMLTNKPLQTPYHRIKITQRDVLEAHEKLEFMKIIEWMIDDEDENSSDLNSNEDEEDEELEGKKIDEDINKANRINFQRLLFSKAYYEFILQEWDHGHFLTQPTPILGIDEINPHPKDQYSKPILMLIDEMDFSGADFMAALLQDNKRALLFGSRTAGAGGYVFTFRFLNHHGIALCSYTASIAERTNARKIEDLGVSPDIEYQLTVEDIQGGYRGYIDAVNQAVESLFKMR